MTSPSPSGKNHFVFHRDPALFRPAPSTVQCGELWIGQGEDTSHDFDDDEEHVSAAGSLLFWIQLPKGRKKLKFRCRRGSVGVLEEHEVVDVSTTNATTQRKQQILEEESYEQVDPQFFDPGYTLAGATGFQIWAGTRLLIETLLVPQETDCLRLQKIQNHLLSEQVLDKQLEQHSTKHIVELGSGIGVVGIALAATAPNAQVILTDLPTLIENVTQWNLYANRRNPTIEAAETSRPPNDWFSTESVHVGEQNGQATTMALDWRIPIDQQLPHSVYSNVDYIVASDCVWLVSMLDALFDTVESIFRASLTSSTLSCPTLLLSFQRRDTFEGDHSPTFTTVQRVISSVIARGWNIECLAWRLVGGGGGGGGGTSTNQKDDSSTIHNKEDGPIEKEVFVFAINPSKIELQPKGVRNRY